MPKNKKANIDVRINGKNLDMKEWKKHEHCNGWCWHCHRGAGGVYGLGFIGAAIFYLQQSTSFWTGVLAILKAIAWPAFLVYHLLGL